MGDRKAGLLTALRRWISEGTGRAESIHPEIDFRVTASFEREPVTRAGPRRPGRFYVYVHRDRDGNIFYIGKGVDDRAWRFGRSGMWQSYVTDYCDGDYEVEVVEEQLSEQSALEVESELISRLSKEPGKRLVNRIFDPPEVDREKKAVFENRDRINRSRGETIRETESEDIEQAIADYRDALEELYDLSRIEYDPTVIGRLRKKYRSGNLLVLDRLTVCLMKTGRHAEAIEAVDRYRSQFPFALADQSGEARNSRATAILRRAARAERKAPVDRS